MLFQQWKVVSIELILQGFGCSGYDSLLAIQQSRNEITERLAGSGSGLNDDGTTGGKVLGNRMRHIDLALSFFGTFER